MDPETAKLVATITGGAGIVGVLLGASVSLLGSLLVSWQTRKGQQELERDKYLRSRRARRVDPFLDRVHTLVYRYAPIVVAVRMRDWETFRGVAPDTATPDLFSESSVLGVGDPALLEATEDFFTARRAVVKLVRSLTESWADGTPPSDQQVAELERASEAVSRAIGELDRAADAYVVGR